MQLTVRARNFSEHTTWNCQEVPSSHDGIHCIMKEQLDRLGFLGSVPASDAVLAVAAHYELHIGQDPILEDKRRRDGVIIGGRAHNGSKWLSKVGTVMLAHRLRRRV